MLRENRRGSANPTRRFQVEKLRTSVRNWRESLIRYSRAAEKEFAKIKTQINQGKRYMTDDEIKLVYRLLSELISAKFKIFNSYMIVKIKGYMTV